MNRFPLRAKTESEEKGTVAFSKALQWCNQSFFDGFIAAHCETPEEYESITTEERIVFMFEAIEKCALLRRETPPKPDFTGGEGTQ